MTRRGLIALGLAGAGLLLLGRPTLALNGERLTAAQVRALADRVIARDFAGHGLDPAMMVAIAKIESDFRPGALRFEPWIGDVSVGLMQTLLGTARWLDSIASPERPYGRIGRPSLGDLLKPERSMYAAAAYLDWLTNWEPRRDGQRASEAFVVRAYNAGPGNWRSTAADAYFARWEAARSALGGV